MEDGGCRWYLGRAGGDPVLLGMEVIIRTMITYSAKPCPGGSMQHL